MIGADTKRFYICFGLVSVLVCFINFQIHKFVNLAMDALGAQKLKQEPKEIDDAVVAGVLKKEAMSEQKPPMLQLEVVSNGKVVLVKGNTKPIKNMLKELGGSWHRTLQGWQYPGTKHANIVDRLKADGHTIDDRFQNLEKTAGEPAQPQPSGCPQNNTEKRKLEDEDANVTDDRYDIFWTSLGDCGKRVKLTVFKKKLYVDIREYRKSQSHGPIVPTKKGITLNMGDFDELKEKLTMIDEEIQKRISS